MRRLISLRQQTAAFSGHVLEVIETANAHVFGYVRRHQNNRVLVLANFSEQEQAVAQHLLRIHAFGKKLTDLMSGALVAPHTGFTLAPYQIAWLQS